MLKKLRPHKPSPPMAVALLALFVALGGTATATHLAVNGTDVVDESLTGADIMGKAATSSSPAVAGTLTGPDIKDASLTWNDLAPSTLVGSRILNDSLTGADVSESTLAEVPSAAQGGIGRTTPGPVCNPEGEGYIVCAVVTLTLPAPGRVLVSGQAKAGTDIFVAKGEGDCQLGSTAGLVTSGPGTIMVASGYPAYVPLVGVTGVLPAGTHSFGVNCREIPPNGMDFLTAVSAVALSAR